MIHSSKHRLLRLHEGAAEPAYFDLRSKLNTLFE